MEVKYTVEICIEGIFNFQTDLSVICESGVNEEFLRIVGQVLLEVKEHRKVVELQVNFQV